MSGIQILLLHLRKGLLCVCMSDQRSGHSALRISPCQPRRVPLLFDLIKKERKDEGSDEYKNNRKGRRGLTVVE